MNSTLALTLEGSVADASTVQLPSAVGGSGASGTVRGVAAFSVAPSCAWLPVLSAQVTVQLTLTASVPLSGVMVIDIEPGEVIVASRGQ